MKLLLDFRIPCLPPSVNSMYSRGTHGVYKKESAKAFAWEMVAAFKKRPHFEGPVAVLLEYHIRTETKFNKRDIDNFLKCTLDGLQTSGQIRNDNKIIFCAQMKIRDEKNFIRGYIFDWPADNEINENIFKPFSKLIQ